MGSELSITKGSIQCQFHIGYEDKLVHNGTNKVLGNGDSSFKQHSL